MAGYRCVNFYDLCRLCSSVAGDKNVQIFSNDGLFKKINECLPITLSEKDKLPKIICHSCQEYVEIFSEFRKSCSNAQKMLESCLNSTKLRNGGQVYIKDETPIKKVLKPIQNPSPTKLIPNINFIATTPTKTVKKNVIAPNQPDFLSSIMQAVGIQTGEEVTENNMTLSQSSTQQHQPTLQTLPQYTLTLDGNTLKTGQIQYKIENAGNLLSQSNIITAKNIQDIQNQQVTLNQVDEFLKLKQKPSIIVKKDNVNPTLTLSTDEPKDKKPKFNLILQTAAQKQAPKVHQQSQIISTTPTKTFTSPNKAQILNIEKILPVVNQTSPTKQVVVPIMVRSEGGRNTIASVTAGGDAAAQLLTQALSLTANQGNENKATLQQQPFAYMQMKLQSNSDGQFTLAPATSNPQQIQLSLSPQQLQQLNFQATAQQIQQPTITVQPSQISIPQNVPTQNDTQTQTQPEPSDKMETSQDEDIYDTFDNDFYQDDEENESHTIEAQEKLPNNVDKKSPTTSKKTVKTLKPVKLKAKIETSPNSDPPPINPEHSEMAKKQLNILTNYSNKRAENESSEKNCDINLTVCDVCKKLFKRKEFLMQHLKSHIGLRPFKCEEAQCNKSFSRKEHLLRHISSHTGKKEFTCNICNKLFSRKDNLNKHKRIHPEAGQQSSRHKSQIIKSESSCDEKGNLEEGAKDTKVKNLVKKVKVKTEKKYDEEAVKTLTIPSQIISQSSQQPQQQPKIVQVIQQPQQLGIKNENHQQIILSMSHAQPMLSQQPKAVYTLPTNFILNPHGSFVTTASSNDLVGNLKFETQ